jgi:pimeloyl-ACP methyl ester carboxylesterase
MYVTDEECVAQLSLTRRGGLSAGPRLRRHNIGRAARESPIRRKNLRGDLTYDVGGGRREARDLSNASLAARLRAISKVDVGARLEKVRLPGLYLRATGDRLVTKAAAEAFAKAAVDPRVVDIEGPHLLLQTSPTDAARVLRAFIHEASAAHSENR